MFFAGTIQCIDRHECQFAVLFDLLKFLYSRSESLVQQNWGKSNGSNFLFVDIFFDFLFHVLDLAVAFLLQKMARVLFQRVQL